MEKRRKIVRTDPERKMSRKEGEQQKSREEGVTQRQMPILLRCLPRAPGK